MGVLDLQYQNQHHQAVILFHKISDNQTLLSSNPIYIKLEPSLLSFFNLYRSQKQGLDVQSVVEIQRLLLKLNV